MNPKTKVEKRMMFGTNRTKESVWIENISRGWERSKWPHPDGSESEIVTALVTELVKDATMASEREFNRETMFFVYSQDIRIRPAIKEVIECGVRIILCVFDMTDEFQTLERELDPVYFRISQFSESIHSSGSSCVPVDGRGEGDVVKSDSDFKKTTEVVINVGYGAFSLTDEMCKQLGKDRFPSEEELSRHDPRLIELVRAGHGAPISDRSGSDGLIIKTIEGNHYRITEYDGWEEIETPNSIKWTVVSSPSSPDMDTGGDGYDPTDGQGEDVLFQRDSADTQVVGLMREIRRLKEEINQIKQRGMDVLFQRDSADTQVVELMIEIRRLKEENEQIKCQGSSFNSELLSEVDNGVTGSTDIVISIRDYSGFYLPQEMYEALGMIDRKNIPRHDPRLVSLVRNGHGAPVSDRSGGLVVKTIQGNRYKIIEGYGYETILTPDTIDWTVVTGEHSVGKD